MHLRQQRQYDALQRQRVWKELPQPQARDVNVGVMGMGVLGTDSAQKLKMLGFNVTGWSRSKKQIDGIECFGASELETFLARNHYIVGLLPYTPDTHHFFNRGLFEKLAKHPILPSPIFINAGRGGSQNEADIASCLEDGTLGGASIDVFEIEPLSETSPLWDFDNAIIAPHIASISDVVALGEYVDRQIERYETGGDLQNVVDRNSGY